MLILGVALALAGGRASGQSLLPGAWEQPPGDFQLCTFMEPAASDDVAARLDRLEAEWAAASQATSSPRSPPACDQTSLPSSCCDRYGYHCYGGSEVLVAKPRFEDGAEEDANDFVLDYHMQAAPRVWVGFHNPTGWGVRGRYSSYEAASSIGDVQHVALAGQREQMTVDTGSFDLEGTQVTDFHRWQMDIGGGIRYGWFEQGVVALQAWDHLFKRFHGVGPVVSAELLRPLGSSGLAWVVNLRGALLVGEATWTSPWVKQNTDDIGAVAEMQIGAQWRQALGEFELFVQGVYEHQTWFGAGTYFDQPSQRTQFSQSVRSHDHDAALMGFAFAVGIEH